ncbi:hypothetical protein OS188_06885 [Xanthomarina sp. F1114]|uniref:hypothetical protein n=1 Tax=Xanthomarina sp. F1114 TaxID=2996019 RepID=UPI00225E6BC4|nr:hypothetical protein [Xanthomarina sp. F1114]MCX7547672.1 hypothetical protein [Xanthomarina sp. F1114]
MNYSKYLNYLLIVIGCIIAIYAQAGEKQDVVILILGIIILMFGLFRVSSGIPSKKDREKNQDLNQEDDV